MLDRFVSDYSGKKILGPLSDINAQKFLATLYYKTCFVFINFISIFYFSLAWAENSFELEFDPYYSNAGYYISLTDEPIPEIIDDNELAIHERMLKATFSAPRFMLLEISVNPLPVVGATIKKYFSSAYNRTNLFKEINLVQALTEGFEEPYAFSLFFGNVIRFKKTGENSKNKNKGYTGILTSIGNKHLLNNDVINDNWAEIEWKYKGDQDFNDKTLSWSFRVGMKVHDHPDITDIVYLAYRRNHFDNQLDTLSFIHNSDIEYKIQLNRQGLGIAQQELFINRKWPMFFFAKSALSLGVGFILERDKYSGALASKSDGFRIIIRPNFEF